MEVESPQPERHGAQRTAGRRSVFGVWGDFFDLHVGLGKQKRQCQILESRIAYKAQLVETSHGSVGACDCRT
jgi:hypothetical protein